MFFIRLLEQTAIISLISITALVLVTKAYYVYCAVRTELIILIQVYKTGSPMPVLNQITSTLHCNTRYI